MRRENDQQEELYFKDKFPKGDGDSKAAFLHYVNGLMSLRRTLTLAGTGSRSSAVAGSLGGGSSGGGRVTRSERWTEMGALGVWLGDCNWASYVN